MSDIISASIEQKTVIEILDTDVNVIVEAVAGSGKSTTVIFISQHFNNKRILQLTYNASLRQELKERVSQDNINNLEIHTYHSFAVKYYDPNAYTDFELRKIVNSAENAVQKDEKKTVIPPYDFIICDESQDMTLLYYRFISKIAKDAGNPFQLIVLGDSKQSLYEFKGADPRYLTMADQIWYKHPYLKTSEFKRTTLRTSYRITTPMADFVNNVMLGEDRMEACRDGSPVMYIHYNKFNLENKLIFEINNLIENGASPSDFFILAGSVKTSNRLIQSIENVLVENNIPCNIPMFENERMDDKVIQGKIVFSTFHSVKGRQRPYVFVVGFSQKYMDFYAKEEIDDKCPNTLYVACTRATKRLYLLEEDKGIEDEQLKFLKKNHHEMKKLDFVEFKGMPKQPINRLKEEKEVSINDEYKEKKHYKNATDLIRFISEEAFDKITPILEKIFIVEKEKLKVPLNIPTIKEMKNGNYEEISDINGIAIPCMYYDYFSKKNDKNSFVIYDVVNTEIEKIKEKHKNKKLTCGMGKLFNYVQKSFKEISKKKSNTNDYLQLANMYIALKENLFFKLKQINKEDYTWLSPSIIKQCFGIIRNSLKEDYNDENDEKNFFVEETIITYDDDYEKMDNLLKQNGIELFRLNARIDLITPKTIWELKCTSITNIEHLLQVVIYAWIWRVATKRETRDFKILNIKTGEIQKLNATNEELNLIMFELFKNIYKKNKKYTNDEFINIFTEF